MAYDNRLEAPRAKKRFGQNFLHDQHVIDKIVRAIHPLPQQPLVEIGPGLGALTAPVLEACGSIDVVELDKDVIPTLEQRCAGLGELRIHQHDALRFDFATLAKSQPLRVIGNLPYNISSPLLFHLLEQQTEITDMHFMLQLEVVQRMVAAPGIKDYGRLTVMLGYHGVCELLFKVSPGAFSPPPKVMSAIVRITPYSNDQRPQLATDYAVFSKVVASAFGQRRKTLNNSLKNIANSEHFAAAEIDPKRRAETLSVGEFVRLANFIAESPILVD